MKADLLIKNGLVYLDGTFVRKDVGVVGEKIAFYCECGTGASAEREIDAEGQYVLPGVIDFHCHIREPGEQEWKEDYTSGTMAAAHGGVTAVCVMPNNLAGSIADAETFALARERGEKGAVIDFAPIPSPLGFQDGTLPVLKEMGASYFKIMELKNKAPLAGNFRCGDTWILDQCLREAAKTDSYVSIHPMDMDWYLGNVQRIQESGEPLTLDNVLHRIYTDEEMSSGAWQLAYYFRHNDCKWIAVHTWHSGYIDLIRLLKKEGKMKILASCEIMPSSIRNFDRLYNRKTGQTISLGHAAKPDWDKIWEAVNDGTIDILGSDHSPHLPENYHEDDPFHSAQGVPAEDYYTNLLLDAVNEGKLTMEKLVEITSVNGARALNWKEKGTNAIGTDADFTICDLSRVWKADESYPIYSKPGLDAMYGQTLKGKVTHTIVRGQIVMKEDEILVNPGYGKFIKPQESKE